jgi:hypothetical protein
VGYEALGLLTARWLRLALHTRLASPFCSRIIHRPSAFWFSVKPRPLWCALKTDSSLEMLHNARGVWPMTFLEQRSLALRGVGMSCLWMRDKNQSSARKTAATDAKTPRWTKDRYAIVDPVPEANVGIATGQATCLWPITTTD